MVSHRKRTENIARVVSFMRMSLATLRTTKTDSSCFKDVITPRVTLHFLILSISVRYVDDNDVVETLLSRIAVARAIKVRSAAAYISCHDYNDRNFRTDE